MILPKSIPYFRDQSIESFLCSHCGYKNHSARDMNPIKLKGVKVVFRVEGNGDMQRSLVLSDTSNVEASVSSGRTILSREIRESLYTNIEGLFMNCIASLKEYLKYELDNDRRAILTKNIEDLEEVFADKAYPFNVTVKDPSGNSFIAQDPLVDNRSEGKYRRTEYERTEADNLALGLMPNPDALPTLPDPDAAEAVDNQPKDTVGMEDFNPEDKETFGSSIVKGEVLKLEAPCPGCGRDAEILMRAVYIPGFEDCHVSGVHCEHCHYRTSDVQVGGATPEKGRKITLSVESQKDLLRDVLSSEFAVLEVPYIPLRAEPGSLSGRFTTVEGLLTRCKDNLNAQLFDAGDGKIRGGDSVTEEQSSGWAGFFKKLDQCINAEVKFELSLTDPMAKSYIQSLTDEGVNDRQLQVVDYVRSEEENEELGLNDMRTENYEEEAVDPKLLDQRLAEAMFNQANLNGDN